MSQARILLFLGLASLLTGVAGRNGAVIALSFCPLAYVGGALAKRLTAVDVSLEHVVEPAFAQVGQRVRVTVTAVNNGTRIERLTLRDVVPHGLSVVDGYQTAQFVVGPDESCTLEYVVEGSRGSYVFEQAHFVATETLGVFRLSGTLASPRVVLVIEPKAERLSDNQIHPERTRGFAGPIPARMAGVGTDFFSLREYQPGDRLRSINWWVTERLAAGAVADIGSVPYSNVFEQQRIADIGFIVDARRNADMPVGHETLFEFTARATDSLAKSFLDDGHRVGLLIYGSGLDMVAIGAGRLQQQRITLALSRARPGEHYVFDRLINLPTRMFAPSTQLVFVGPVHRADLEAVIALRGRGYGVLVVSPSPVYAELVNRPLEQHSRVDLMAVEFAQIERARSLNQLRRNGIVVVDWDLETPLHEVVRRAAMAGRGQRTVRSA